MFVASFTDAWIETTISEEEMKIAVVASFTDAWIETKKYRESEHGKESHLLQMRGLKHERTELCQRIESGRIFYRCVD